MGYDVAHALREQAREDFNAAVRNWHADGLYDEGRAVLVNQGFRDWGVRLTNFAYRKTGDRARAEELVQEAFIRMNRHMHRFNPEAKFSTWAYTIVGNLAKNELRNRSRRRDSVSYDAVRPGHRQWEFPDAKPQPDELCYRAELADRIEGAIQRLSPHFQEVLYLREFDGLSYEDISAEIGVNLGTVKSRLHRARSGLATLLTPYVD